MEENVFFTSDTHYGHKNIIKFSNRPFKDVEHMNEALIQGWNSVVGEDDVVYHLGDVSLTSASKTSEILNRLNGKIHLIRGNHEKSVLRKEGNRSRFETIEGGNTIIVNKQVIYLNHYSCRVWDQSHRGSWCLYGHSHDSLEYAPWGKSMDVGVDTAARILGEYRPFSFAEIKKIMDKRDIHEIDHHVSRKEE